MNTSPIIPEKVTISMRPVCPHPSWIEIDTVQFRKNLQAIRKMIGERAFCLPVKANGYGHGMCQIGKIAEEEGVDRLGVSCLKEALELRLHGIAIPIVIFGAIHEEQIPDLVAFDLEFSISSLYKAELVARKWNSFKRKCKVHLEVDTGMRRTGVRPENALALLEKMDRLGCFEVIGLYSHFATADVPNDPFATQQIEAFATLVEKVRDRKILCHLANSGGVVYYPQSHFDMVRPGLLSYGYFPNSFKNEMLDVRPCLRLKAKVSYFKVVQKGAGISYGHLYRTEKETRIATVPIGYGDGYRRGFSGKASVLIRGKRFPIAGAICMDQFMVDIGKEEAYVGDEVVLIGSQGDEEITLWDLAKSADSIPHEILCAFNDRLPRLYL